MINTIADLLKEFSDKENQKLKELDITHPPTIGAMYEGLTADMLQKSLFEGINLVVAKSCFIKGSHTEFDIILADGQGKPIPYTDKLEFTPEQVLVVIQVKKTFYAKDLKDSYENLMGISDLFVGLKPQKYMLELATDSIHHTLQRSIHDYQNGKLSFEEEYVYHTLLTETQLPVTIVLGYNGLKSEFSLRDKYYKYLKGKISHYDEIKRKYGPTNFPALMICKDYSIVKMNGLPFNAPLRKTKNGWWDFTASCHYNPMYFFLETIWSKLSYRYDLPQHIFGDDLTTPKMSKFLSCKIEKQGNMTGWDYKYHFYKEDVLKSNNSFDEWQPDYLNYVQYRVMSILCTNGMLDLSKNPQIEKEAIDFGYKSLADLIDSLCNTGYVTKIGNNKIELISKGCQVIMMGDKFLIGENNSGRFTNWLIKHFSGFLHK